MAYQANRYLASRFKNADFSLFAIFSPSYKFSTVFCRRLVKCEDSDKNLYHCCGLEGHNLPLWPHMMPGEANDAVKFLTKTKIPPKVKNVLKAAPPYNIS